MNFLPLVYHQWLPPNGRLSTPRRALTDVDLDDLSRKGCLPALAALARADPKPLAAKEFVKASGMDAGAAIRLRVDLEEIGLIAVEVTREQGSVKEYAISLTTAGRELTPHIVGLEDVLKKQSRKERRTRN